MASEVKEFTGSNNFMLWRKEMRAYLQQQGLVEAIKGEDRLDASLSENARCAILLSLRDNVRRLVWTEKTAAAMWTKLRTLYTKKSSVPRKRSRHQDSMAKKAAKLEEETPTHQVVEKRRRLKRKIEYEEQIYAKQNAKLEALKLKHEKLMSQIAERKMEELLVLVYGGIPPDYDYESIRSIGRGIKSIIDMTLPRSRVTMKAKFYYEYEKMKSELVPAIEWAQIEAELGCDIQSWAVIEDAQSPPVLPTVAHCPHP